MATVQKSDSTDTVSLILEILFGIFGVLGMGWFYAGNVGVGVAALVGYILLLILEGVAIGMTAGLAACLVVPINIALIVVSGFKARDHVRNTGAQGNFVYVVVALIVPIMLVCGAIMALVLAGPVIDSVFNNIVRELEMTPIP